jgi:hypothetical protein
MNTMEGKKMLYNIKGFGKKGWENLGTIYLNPFDSPETKEKLHKLLIEKYGNDYSFNVVSLLDVYL